MTRKSTWRLWQPSTETIEAIANTLSAHWAAARSLQPKGPFWTDPATWLRQKASRIVAGTKPVEVEHSEGRIGEVAAR